MYTADWFSHNIPNWTQLLSGLKGKDNVRCLEIGCFEGKATRWVLDNILTGQYSTIMCVDTFEGSMEHRDMNFPTDRTLFNFKENMGEDLQNRVFFEVAYSQEWMRRHFVHDWYDFIYIDGSHQAPDVLEDGVLAFRMLKKGGIMIYDDYAWDAYKNDPTKNPRLAIDSFLAVFNGKYELLHKQYQVALRKV